MGTILDKEHICIACTLEPTLRLGRIFGYMPIIAECENEEKAPSFRKSKYLQYFGLTWMLMMISQAMHSFWIISQHEGLNSAETLSDILGSWNCAFVFFFGFIRCDLYVMELNGMSAIIEEHKALLTKSTKKKIRMFATTTIALHSVFLVFMLINAMDNGLMANPGKILDLAAVIAGGTFFASVINQSWIKMLFIQKIITTYNCEMKVKLQRQRPTLAWKIEEFTRLQSALVRNYTDCSRFMNPGMLMSIVISVVNLIVSMYMMMSALQEPVGQATSNAEVLTRTYFLTIALIVFTATQQWLEDVVSRKALLFFPIK